MQASLQWLTPFLLLLHSAALSAQSRPAGVARRELLQQRLSATTVEQVQIDEITLAPGQAAPVHYHPCEVYGYVVAGQIAFQPAGRPQVLLNAGNSFREAAGQRIPVFKNASADQPATFVAMYLARKNQPLIILTNDHKN